MIGIDRTQRLHIRVGIEAGGKKRARIGLARRFENLPYSPEFHNLSPLHDHDVIGKIADHRQVMRDEDEGEADFTAQLVKKCNNLRLDRHVERRDRFIADDELRLQRQRAGNRDPLPLATGKLMRITAHMFRREADLMQQFRDPFAPFRFG